MEGKKKDTEKRRRLKHEHHACNDLYLFIYLRIQAADCTNVVASKYFRWQDLCQAVGGLLAFSFCVADSLTLY